MGTYGRPIFDGKVARLGWSECAVVEAEELRVVVGARDKGETRARVQESKNDVGQENDSPRRCCVWGKEWISRVARSGSSSAMER